MSESVYKVIGAQPITEGSAEPESMVAWIGLVMNAFIGILTDPPSGTLTQGPWLPDYDDIHRIASIEKAFLAEGLPSVTGLPPSYVLQVGEELRGVDFDHAVATVDGETVQARTITYRGLDFILGNDVREHPFTMFRLSGSTAPWPGLLTTHP